MPLSPDQKSANYADIDNKSGPPHDLAILQREQGHGNVGLWPHPDVIEVVTDFRS